MSTETFTNGELFSLIEPLKALAKIDVPAKVGIKVARLIRALNREIEVIAEVRNKLITKYGETNEHGGLFINGQSPRFPEFAEENDALMKGTAKVEFEKAVLPDEVVVSVSMLVALEPFLAVADIVGLSPNGEATNISQLVSLVKS